VIASLLLFEGDPGMSLKKSLMIVIVIMASTVLTCINTSQACAKDDQLQVAEAINAFGLDLYGKLKTSDKNLFFSPYSASVALTMALAGARGDTETQMAKVLHYGQSNVEIHSVLSSLNQVILKSAKDSGVTLKTANAMWGQKDFGFRQQFLKLIQTHYGSAFRQVDFIKAPQAAIAEINQWAKQQTEGRIRNIVKNLDPLTRFILANAIYFKGK
jgi:serpin B